MGVLAVAILMALTYRTKISMWKPSNKMGVRLATVTHPFMIAWTFGSVVAWTLSRHPPWKFMIRFTYTNLLSQAMSPKAAYNNDINRRHNRHGISIIQQQDLADQWFDRLDFVLCADGNCGGRCYVMYRRNGFSNSRTWSARLISKTLCGQLLRFNRRHHLLVRSLCKYLPRFGFFTIAWLIMVRYTSAMEVATLTTTCAEVTQYWSAQILDIDIGWRITVFLLLIIIINVLGVKVGRSLFNSC